MPEPVVYEDVITYPAVPQDLAFVVDEDVEAGDARRGRAEAAGRELREARVFDVYRGEQVGAGRKSVAFAPASSSRPSGRSPTRTPRSCATAIVAALAERFGAELRA